MIKDFESRFFELFNDLQYAKAKIVAEEALQDAEKNLGLIT